MRADRLAEIEAKVDAIAKAQMAAQSPVLSAILASLTTDELRVLEIMAERLAAEGLELALRPIARFTPEEVQAMSPRDRAEAYRILVKGEPAHIAGGRKNG